jgi:hypothetical protein
VDLNGTETGAKIIFGRLCTVISFSNTSDYSGIGFFDGSCYILNEKGEIIYKERFDGYIIKGIALSDNGKFFLIHYGNTEKDLIQLVNAGSDDNDKFIIPLKYVHSTRTAIMITNDGESAILDNNRIILIHDNETTKIIKIPPKSPGLASISVYGIDPINLYSACYMGINGAANFLVFLDDGTVIFHKVLNKEDFIESSMYGNFIVLRGSRNLYSYSFRIPGIQ